MDEDETGKYARQRELMVRDQIAGRMIHDGRVIEAMRRVPRHVFVPHEYRAYAYEDGPLPIGEGQTISQPYIVALMCQLARLAENDTVLEVGTGSGYGAAVLAQLARQVHTIERHDRLAELAGKALKDLGVTNVQVHQGDGSLGLAEYAPFQAIVVTAAAPSVPEPLLAQLDEGGRLVLPVGDVGMQMLECWERHGGQWRQEQVAPVAFVPLLGKHGWREK